MSHAPPMDDSTQKLLVFRELSTRDLELLRLIGTIASTLSKAKEKSPGWYNFHHKPPRPNSASFAPLRTVQNVMKFLGINHSSRETSMAWVRTLCVYSYWESFYGKFETRISNTDNFTATNHWSNSFTWRRVWEKKSDTCRRPTHRQMFPIEVQVDLPYYHYREQAWVLLFVSSMRYMQHLSWL